MNLIEITAVVFSLLSVILTVKNNIWCWSTGIVGIIFYGILFYRNQIWGNTLLQMVFITQSILGWYNWNKPSKYPIKWIRKSSRETVFGFTILLAILIGMITRHSGGEYPYFDGITTSLSIMAMILMAYRKVDSWILWIIADVIFVGFFYINGLYLSSIVYFIFLILSIVGLFEWKKGIKMD